MWELNKAEYAEWQNLVMNHSGDYFVEISFWIIGDDNEPINSYYPNLRTKVNNDDELINAVNAWNGKLEVVCNERN